MRIKENIPLNSLAFRIKADFLRALAHPARLAILEYLKKGEASVGRMMKDLGMEQSSLSKHLATLRHSGILSTRQEKVSVFYSVKDRDIYQILRPIAEILRKKLKESEKILNCLGKV